MTKIACVIVTYNGAQWIQKCLSLLLKNKEDLSVWVIDNNSTDDTRGIVKSFGEVVTLVELEANLGFGAANNLGIQRALQAACSHIFLLNQDVYLEEGILKGLLEASLANPSLGILSPVQLRPTGEEVDEAFTRQLQGAYNSLPKIRFGDIGSRHIIPRHPLPVRFIGAAVWFMPVEVISKVGLFHPAFYHYGEDNNYAARVQYFGYGIAVLPWLAAIHDRKQRSENSSFLFAKLRSFPLHQLLDIRKPFWKSWLTGFYQLLRIWRKVKDHTENPDVLAFKRAKAWFFKDMSKAKSIRKNLKKGYHGGTAK